MKKTPFDQNRIIVDEEIRRFIEAGGEIKKITITPAMKKLSAEPGIVNSKRPVEYTEGQF